TQRLGQRVGRIVHDDVDASEAIDRAVDQRRERVEIAGMGGNADRVASHAREVRLRLGASVGLSAPDGALRARGHETLGDRTPDAARPARDDRNTVGEVEQLLQLLAVHGGHLYWSTPASPPYGRFRLRLL